MATTTKDARLQQLTTMLDWQTAFFRNALAGISNDDAHKRLDTEANHIAWLAGSIVQQRYELLQFVTKNSDIKQQADSLFNENQGIKGDITYPLLSQYVADWAAVTPQLLQALNELEPEMADEKLAMGEMEMTFLEWLTFSVYREANHIGQIALWRRILGYEPMKYM